MPMPWPSSDAPTSTRVCFPPLKDTLLDSSHAGILRTIWSLCTPVATMNLGQFYTAMRYISLAQSGEMPISRDRLVSTMSQSFPLPVFSGIPVPPPTPQNTSPSPVPGAAGGTSIPPFAITPEEHAKYHGLFLTYDKDGDGYITATEAVPIFAKSGLDNTVLAVIWQMSDLDHDNRLTSKEFSLAFHLILCVGKRKLPCPSTLPPPLIAFVQNAPAVPVAAHPNPVAPTPLPAQQTPPSPSLAAPVNVPQASVHAIPSAPTQTKPVPQPVNLPEPESLRAAPSNTNSGSLDEQMELESTVRSISEVAKKSVASQEHSITSMDKASSSLKYVLQKLTAEKIALTSSLQNLEEDTAKANANLEATLREVAQLQQELEELRHQVESKRGGLGSVGNTFTSAESEKAQLLKSIADLRSQLDASFETNKASALRVKELASEQTGFQAVIDANNATAAQLQVDIQRGKNEIQVLREILASFQNSKGAVDASNQSLVTQAKALERTSVSLKSEVTSSHARVVSLSEEKAAVEREKAQLTARLADASGVSASPSPVITTSVASAPTLLGSSNAPHKSMVIEDVDDDVFDDGDTGKAERSDALVPPKYENIGDDDDFPAPKPVDDADEFPEPVPVENKSEDPFGAEPFQSSAQVNFDEFPASKSGEAFDAFPAATAEGGKSNLEGFDTDGFGDFAAHTPRKSADGSDFPPPSGDFAFGDFDSGFVEESFTAAHDSPW